MRSVPFVTDLKEQGNFDRVLLLTFSEFGRRVQENATAEPTTERLRRCLCSAAA
ncbi:MAG: DUF1501 domain-containing protein [Chthoniobacterales bacterium]|nr:DUF1501 domain-containing protein [Chthoniobacterales bacterium]